MRPVIRNANICMKNMLTICDIPIRARTMDPSFAQRNLTITQIHQSRVGGEIPSLIAKVTVNKVSIFNGIWYFVPVDVHFHYECGYMWTVTKCTKWRVTNSSRIGAWTDIPYRSGHVPKRPARPAPQNRIVAIHRG